MKVLKTRLPQDPSKVIGEVIWGQVFDKSSCKTTDEDGSLINIKVDDIIIEGKKTFIVSGDQKYEYQYLKVG